MIHELITIIIVSQLNDTYTIRVIVVVVVVVLDLLIGLTTSDFPTQWAKCEHTTIL